MCGCTRTGQWTRPHQPNILFGCQRKPCHSADPRQPHVLPDFTLGLADISDWPARAGEAPWILDPKECLKLVRPGPDYTGPGSGNNSRKRKWKKKHHHGKKRELKVTNHGEGSDSLVWSHGGTGSNLEYSSSPDSSFSSTQKTQRDNTAGSTIQHGHSGSSDRTPLLSLGTVRKLDAGDFDDSPLSDRLDYEPSDGDQEMTIIEERPGTTIGNKGAGPADTEMGGKDTGRNPGNPGDTQDPVLPSTSTQQLGPTGPDTGTLALAVEIQALTSPALAITMAQIQEETATSDDNGDTNEEKIWLDAYKSIMRGLHVATQTLSDRYQQACLEVQGLVKQSLDLTTEKDRKFVSEASTALRRWVKAVQLAIDCLGKSVAEQSCLLEDARKAGMQIIKDILALYPPEDIKGTTDPANDLTVQVFTMARRHVEDAFLALHGQLLALVHQHVPLVQASVFLAAIFQIMCTYWQETDNMVLSQTIMPAQVVPNIWGVGRGSLRVCPCWVPQPALPAGWLHLLSG